MNEEARGTGFSKVNRQGSNQLLASLPAAERERFVSRCHRERLQVKDVLYKPDGVIAQVYFPLSGMISLVIHGEDGGSIEVGTVGNEGMVGTQVLFGTDRSQNEALCQVEAEALRMPVAAFKEEVKDIPALKHAGQRYAQALMTLVSQSVACSQLHSLEQRMCRWLLITHDKAGADEILLSQQFVAQMLGVHRPSVSLVAATLARAGLIAYTRGKVTVLDRAGLESGSCECYAIVRREYERLLLS